ncbi:MAG: peptide chain release factor N(5)-glutamine methyltransferase [Bacteroidetes bacterium]|nr:MAG: peptide chain release factor N(5)-glutamine methyltransferase [Bacteroidota bacterium]
MEEIRNLFHTELKNDYSKEEIDAFFFISIEEITGIIRDDFNLRMGEPAKLKQAEKLHTVISELKTHKPIQYILGSTKFYGCKLRVNEHVLIPRPETEELVELIVSDIRKNTNPSNPFYSPSRNALAEQQGKGEINIIDIGTGSGCIAIALKKKLPMANVSAIDILEDTLLVAKANAILNQTKINFLQADILSSLSPGKEVAGEVKGTFNIIVSNPPYVRLSEKKKMDRNVLDFEPPAALFVNDSNPLLFYNAIADFALRNLSPNGKLYFEINEALGSDVKKLLEEKEFKNVEVKKDMSGKDRFASGMLIYQ